MPRAPTRTAWPWQPGCDIDTARLPARVHGSHRQWLQPRLPANRVVQHVAGYLTQQTAAAEHARIAAPFQHEHAGQEQGQTKNCADGGGLYCVMIARKQRYQNRQPHESSIGKRGQYSQHGPLAVAATKSLADDRLYQYITRKHARQAPAHIARPRQSRRSADSHGTENKAWHSQVENEHIKCGRAAERNQPETFHKNADENQRKHRQKYGQDTSDGPLFLHPTWHKSPLHHG